MSFLVEVGPKKLVSEWFSLDKFCSLNVFDVTSLRMAKSGYILLQLFSE